MKFVFGLIALFVFVVLLSCVIEGVIRHDTMLMAVAGGAVFVGLQFEDWEEKE